MGSFLGSTPPPSTHFYFDPPTHSRLHSLFLIFRGGSCLLQPVRAACTSFHFSWPGLEPGKCQTTECESQSVCMCSCVSPSLTDCSLKVKDVLREFDADGSLAQHRHGEVSSICSTRPELLHSLSRNCGPPPSNA